MRLSEVGISRYTRKQLNKKSIGLFMQRYFLLLLFILFSTISLTGCGNKGPLYLPAEPIQVIISDSEEIDKDVTSDISESERKSDE